MIKKLPDVLRINLQSLKHEFKRSFDLTEVSFEKKKSIESVLTIDSTENALVKELLERVLR